LANVCAGISDCIADLPQCFAVLNGGQGALDFSVSADVPWLQVGRATCPYRAVSSSSASPPEVVALLRANNLPSGSYEGHVQVIAPQAINSPQTVTVKLTVVTQAAMLGPMIRPTGLVFAGAPAQTPGSLDVYLYNFSQQSFHYVSNSLFLDGDGWFTYSTPVGDVKPSQQSASLKVYPDFSKLSAGAYHGSMTVQTVFAVQPVEVLAAVAGGGAAIQSSHAVFGCTQSALNGIFTLVQPEFTAAPGQPFPLELYVTDDCGVPLTSGSVVASFSNGDAGINLVSLQDGRWAGTWIPQQPAVQNRVGITVHASTPAAGLTADLRRSGNLQ
jgi:hypothetical protein